MAPRCCLEDSAAAGYLADSRILCRRPGNYLPDPEIQTKILEWGQAVVKNGLLQPSGDLLREILVGSADYIRRGDFPGLNRILSELNPWELHSETVNALLRAPYVYRKLLPSWDEILEAAETVVISRGEMRILSGLRDKR